MRVERVVTTGCDVVINVFLGLVASLESPPLALRVPVVQPAGGLKLFKYADMEPSLDAIEWHVSHDLSRITPA